MRAKGEYWSDDYNDAMRNRKSKLEDNANHGM